MSAANCSCDMCHGKKITELLRINLVATKISTVKRVVPECDSDRCPAGGTSVIRVCFTSKECLFGSLSTGINMNTEIKDIPAEHSEKISVVHFK